MSQNPLKDFMDEMNRLGEGYLEFHRRIASWTQRLTPAMKRFLEVARQVGDGFSVLIILQTTTFARGGWSEIPLREMTLSESTQLVERLWKKTDEEVQKELDVVIPKYFRRDDYAPLSKLVSSWQRHFGDRYQVFEDALWAHKEERYTLSVPTLAAQVEGIIREFTGDYVHKTEWKTKFLGHFSYDGKSPPRFSQEDLREVFALPLNERFERAEELRKHLTLARINELFEYKSFSDPDATSVVNRHVILHGVFEKYGEIESLKLFFVLDLLHEAIHMYKEDCKQREEHH